MVVEELDQGGAEEERPYQKGKQGQAEEKGAVVQGFTPLALPFLTGHLREEGCEKGQCDQSVGEKEEKLGVGQQGNGASLDPGGDDLVD